MELLIRILKKMYFIFHAPRTIMTIPITEKSMQPNQKTSTRKTRLASFLWLGILAASPSQASLIHQYQLNGSLSDDFGGPSLVAAGGALGPSSYVFGANQGLSLSNALASSGNYSIETIFRFTNLSGYRKILDFNNLALDSGLYNYNGSLNFYPVASFAAGFVPNQDIRLIITRNSTTKQFSAYIDGIQQLTFIDSSDRAVFTATNNIMQFFKDDFATSQNEASGGAVDLIKIYDTPLSTAEISNLGNPSTSVPEPSTLLLFTTSLAGLFVRWSLAAKPV